MFFVVVAICNPVFAAKQINVKESKKHQDIGDVSVNNISGDMDTVVNALNKKADENNAPYFHITSLGSHGDSSYLSGTAVLYK